MKVKHEFTIPFPDDASKVEALMPDGTWEPATKESHPTALAYTGKQGEYGGAPIAWYPSCRIKGESMWDTCFGVMAREKGCNARLALDRTCERFSCANGRLILSCDEHPDYKGIRAPRVDCDWCWMQYNENHGLPDDNRTPKSKIKLDPFSARDLVRQRILDFIVSEDMAVFCRTEETKDGPRRRSEADIRLLKQAVEDYTEWWLQ